MGVINLGNDKLKKLRLLYAALILMLVLSAFAVPYLMLNSINLFRGAFLFWLLFALIVIFLTIKITTYWRNN
jgi:hypothetical protein